MLVKKVTRSYSKSINTRAYGAPESWIKVESIYEAEIESNDDATKVSEMIYEQAKKEVVTAVNTIAEQIKSSLQPAPIAPPVVPQYTPVPMPSQPAPAAPQYAPVPMPSQPAAPVYPSAPSSTPRL